MGSQSSWKSVPVSEDRLVLESSQASLFTAEEVLLACDTSVKAADAVWEHAKDKAETWAGSISKFRDI